MQTSCKRSPTLQSSLVMKDLWCQIVRCRDESKMSGAGGRICMLRTCTAALLDPKMLRGKRLMSQYCRCQMKIGLVWSQGRLPYLMARGTLGVGVPQLLGGDELSGSRVTHKDISSLHVEVREIVCVLTRYLNSCDRFCAQVGLFLSEA